MTDIDYNGEALWITNLRQGKYRARDAEAEITPGFLDGFVHNIANSVNKQFNSAHKVFGGGYKGTAYQHYTQLGGSDQNQYLYSEIAGNHPKHDRWYGKERILSGKNPASVIKLCAGRDEFCVWRGTGGRKNGMRKIFYAVHSAATACDYN